MNKGTMAVLALAGVGAWYAFGKKKGPKGAISLIAPDKAIYGFDPSFNVQQHLQKHGSVLARVTFPGYVGYAAKPAAQIIKDVARDHNVKSQYLLVSLDREQGLVSGIGSRLAPGSAALQHALDWATGHGAWHAKPESEWDTSWKGFEMQLGGAASAANHALHGQGAYEDIPSIVAHRKPMELLDSRGNPVATVTPTNIATAFFYRYTPSADVGAFNRQLYQKHAPGLLT